MKIKFYFLWLSLICIGVFILQNLPGIPGFTELFVLNDLAVNNYEIWRFVSSIFLHASITHLAFNLFALLLFGFILEKLIGSRNFLIVFFASGIIANIISVNYYDSSLGASGAIYGILGAIAVIKPLMMVWAFGLILPMFIAVILWIIADILRGFGVFGISNIGIIAHLSGIIIGFMIGIWLRFFRKKYKFNKSKARVEIPEVYMKEWEERNM